MGDDISILLKATLDVNKSIDNINKQILTIQDKLKSVNISLNLSDFKSELEKAFGQFENSAKKANSQSLEFKGIKETVSQIKELSGSLENIYKDLKKVGDVKSLKNIYDTDGNVSGFNVQLEKTMGNLKEISNYNVFGQYNKETQEYEYALTKVSSTIKEVANTSKKLNDENKKSTQMSNAKNLQAYYDNARRYTLEVKKGAMDATEALSKLESVMFKSDKSGFTWQFDGLNAQQQKAILADRTSLENQILQSKKSQFNVEKQIAQEQDKQTASTIKQNSTITEMNNKLSSIKGKYGSSVDSGEMARVQAMIDSLKQLDPATKTYTARVNECQKAISNLGRESADGFKKTQDAISDTTSKTSQLGLTIRTLGQMFMVGSPIYLAQQVFRDMSQSVNELNKSITDIRIVTGMGVNEANDLRDSYNELGKSLGATTNEMLSGATEWFRQGKSIAETQELITASMMGAKLSGVESAQMTEYLTSTLNGFQLSADKATSVVDKMVAVDNAAATSVEELAIALQQTSSSAQMAGVDLDELLGYIGTVSSVTRRSAEVVGQSFKTIFARYQNIKLGEFTEDGVVASDVIKAMDAVGIKVMENETTFRDFGDTIQELSGKWDTLNQAEKIAVANAMAGVRQRESFLVLMDNMTQANDLTTKSIESGGLALDRYNVYLQSTDAAINRFRASAEAVFIKTLNSQTVNNIINMGSAMLEFVSATGGLIPILSQIMGLIMIIKADAMSSFLKGAISGIGSLGTSLNMLKANLVGMVLQMKGVQTATTMTAMTMQSMIPIIGALTIVISGIAMAYNSYQQQLEENSRKLQERIDKTKDEIESVNSLVKSYDELKDSAKTDKESRDKLLQVQKDIVKTLGLEKDAIDLVNGSYEDNIDVINRANQKKLEQLEIDAKIKYQEDTQKLDKFVDKQNKKTTDMSINVQFRTDDVKNDFKNIIQTMNAEFEDSFKGVVKEKFTGDMFFEQDISAKSAEELFEMLTRYKELMADGGLIDTKIYQDVSSSLEELKTYMDALGISTETYSETQAKLLIQSEQTKMGISDLNTVTEEQYNIMKQNIAKNFMNGLSMTAEQAEKMQVALGMLDNIFPQFSSGIDDTGDSAEDTTTELEKLVLQLDEISSKANEQYNSYNLLIDAIEKLGQGHQLTGDEIYALTSAYGELTPKIDETTGQMYLERDALIELAGKSGEDAQQAIIAQINKSKEVAIQSVKRIGMIQDEILAINSAIDAYAMLSNMATTSTGGYRPQGLDDETWAKQAANTRNGVGKYINEIADLYKKAEETANNIGSVNGLLEGKKKGSGSGNKSNDPFKKDVDNIRKTREELEQEIAILKEKMNLANVMGDTSAFEEYSNKMSILLDKMRGLSAVEIGKLEGLKNTYKKQEQLAELETAIQEARKQGFIDERQYQEQMISLINTRYDLDKRVYDDKVRDLELEQLRNDEGSERYQQIEEEKYNMLLQLQQSYLDKIRQLQAMGLSQNQEDVRKYIDLYKDAEEEIWNKKKEMAEKKRQLEIDNLNKDSELASSQKDALKTLHDMTMKMIKTEQDAKKKAHQDQLKAYKDEIDARKKAIQDESDERDYQKGLKEKSDKVAEIEKELLELENNNSDKAIAEKIRLQEELKQAQDELADYQYKNEVDLRQEALDEEYKLFEEEKQKEIDKIEDLVNNEYELRRMANDKLRGMNDTTYKELLEWNRKYGVTTSSLCTEMCIENYTYMQVNPKAMPHNI